MKTRTTLLTLILLLPGSIHAKEASLQDQLLEEHCQPAATEFHGYNGFDFKVPSGASARIITPKKAAKGNPWIWRARFWGHQPALDRALLAEGYHLCYCDISNLFGNPQAVARWDEFYQLSQALDLHPKPILEGMSRGGLIIFNWAKANPNKVTAIYADNPVCDIRSWPRGKSPKNWKQCLSAYQMTEEESTNFKGNPLDGLEPLAKAKIPLFLVLGEEDKVVPIKDNALILSERYQALGGEVKTWQKPGLGHHPHGLKPVDPLVKALLEAQ